MPAPYPGPLPQSPPAVPPHLRDSWQLSSPTRSTASSLDPPLSKFHEHLPPPSPPAHAHTYAHTYAHGYAQEAAYPRISHVGTMFIPSPVAASFPPPPPPPPPPVPARSPSRPPRPPRTASQDDLIPAQHTFVTPPLRFSPDTPTAPSFPASAFRAPREKEKVRERDVERGLPAPPEADSPGARSLAFSHRLTRQIEAVKQFVNLPYPFHAPLPLPLPVTPLSHPAGAGGKGAYAIMDHAAGMAGQTAYANIESARVAPLSPSGKVSPIRPLLLSKTLSQEREPDYGYPRRMSVAMPVNIDIHWQQKGASEFDRHGRPVKWMKEKAQMFPHMEKKDKDKKDKKKKKKKRLLCILIIIIILLIIFGTVGGVLGSRASSSSTSSASTNTTAPPEAAEPIVTYSLQPTAIPVTLPGTTLYTTATATVTYTTSVTPAAFSAAASATPTPTPLSPALQSCLTQFQLAAPATPLAYPCGTCAPLVQTLPNDLAPGAGQNTNTSGPSTGGVSPGAILQFCSLQALFLASATATNTSSSNPLTGEGWMVNNDPCSGWTGITCDTTGRVTGLMMTFPAVPATFAEGSFSGLVSLQTIEVIGNGQVPAGAAPQSLLGLTQLVKLQLQTTGLTALQDDAFAAMTSLQQLTLAGNSNLGTSLPSSLAGLPLTSLVVNGQNLQTSLTDLLSTTVAFTTTLQTLDLSGNTISSPMPSSLAQFTALTSLTLSNNNLSNLPSTLPGSLRVLDMAANPALKGTVPGQVCSLALQTCDFRGTGMSASGACGACVFGS